MARPYSWVISQARLSGRGMKVLLMDQYVPSVSGKYEKYGLEYKPVENR